MNKFGPNFWKVFLPFHILGVLGIFYAFDHLLTLFVFWFLIGVIGNGVAAHRYFAHGQFETWVPVRWALAFIATLGAIGPISNWPIQHKVHHAFTDTEADPHTPIGHGVWYVFYSWTFPQGNNEQQYLQHRWAKRIAVQQMREPMFKFFHAHHYKIIYVFCVALLLINPVWLLMYCLAYCLDFLRLGSINYFCHTSGYRNFNTKDSSTNNVWLGWLGMGFGWHNNHHANPGRLVVSERWWEIDVEGYIGKLLSKPTQDR
jgi:fatty-acid desaturase